MLAFLSVLSRFSFLILSTLPGPFHLFQGAHEQLKMLMTFISISPTYISPLRHQSPERNSQPQLLRLRNLVYLLFRVAFSQRKQSYNCHIVKMPKSFGAVFTDFIDIISGILSIFVTNTYGRCQFFNVQVIFKTIN